MRSAPTFLSATVLGAALALAAPAAHAAAPADTAACSKATAAAKKAESDYQAALKDYKDTTENGGHPGQAEQDNVDQLKSEANSTASDAARACPDAKMPSGSMSTGIGSTSQGTDNTDLALGAGLLAAVAGGTLVLRRRHAQRQS
jgi:hypothetical protein